MQLDIHANNATARYAKTFDRSLCKLHKWTTVSERKKQQTDNLLALPWPCWWYEDQQWTRHIQWDAGACTRQRSSTQDSVSTDCTDMRRGQRQCWLGRLCRQHPHTPAAQCTVTSTHTCIRNSSFKSFIVNPCKSHWKKTTKSTLKIPTKSMLSPYYTEQRLTKYSYCHHNFCTKLID